MKTEKSCGCIVIKNHKVLIVSAKDDNGAIFWSFPKGHQEENESDTETAIRETREETGINPIITDKNPIIVKHPVHNNTAMKFIHFFIATTKTNQTDIQEDEIEATEWVSFEEASKRLRSYYHQAWQEALLRMSGKTTD